MLRWRQVMFGGLGAIFFVLAVAPSALALDPGNYTLLTTPFYDPNVECTVDVPVSLSGSGNPQKAFNYFVSKGLTTVQAAGIVGNLMRESGVDPTAVQPPEGQPPAPDSQDPLAAGALGWGIAQWTPGVNILGAARDAGIKTPIYELGTQLDVIWAQMTNKNSAGYYLPQTYTDVKAATTVEAAAKAFLDDFEKGPAANETTNLQIAVDKANQLLQGSGGSGGTSVTTTSSNGCNGTTAGQDTTYVDGFTVYSQYDPAWANKPYGTSNIAASGCGPSAMAMIVTTLTGQQITPDITAAYADSQGLYVDGEGSSWSIGPELAKHWGLSSKKIGADAASITAALESNSLVIVAGRGPEPFTTAGHFIVIRAVKDGQWMVGDSAHPDANKKAWSPDLILSGIITDGSSGSVYAISK